MKKNNTYQNKSNNLLKLTIIIVLSSLIVGLAICFCFQSIDNHDNCCITNLEESTKLENASIIHDTKFGGIYINISREEFEGLGFNFGDSVNVVFSNGYELPDLPYYNGYYVDVGDPLLVAYPGYEYIELSYNYGDDLWIIANVTEDTTCSIYLNQENKYLKTQELRDIHYSEEQGNTEDEVFANFRAMKIGDLKENFVYRGASPIDNKHNRAAVSDRLLEKYNIKYIVDLSDSDEDIKEFSAVENFNSPNFMKLYNSKKVSVLSMNVQYKTEDFAKRVVKGLIDMSNNDGPYYIHCLEGKDRTGFYCMIIGAIADSSYNEIIEDYMTTYDNYYGITLESSKEKYDAIKESNIDEMLKFMTGEEDIAKLKDADMSELVNKYLIRYGMNEEQIQLLKNKITK